MSYESLAAPALAYFDVSRDTYMGHRKQLRQTEGNFNSGTIGERAISDPRFKDNCLGNDIGYVKNLEGNFSSKDFFYIIFCDFLNHP